MDKRLSNVEVAIRDLNARIDNLSDTLNARIDSLSDSLSSRIDSLSAKIDSNFKWIVGMWVTAILAFITTIFTILLKG